MVITKWSHASNFAMTVYCSPDDGGHRWCFNRFPDVKHCLSWRPSSCRLISLKLGDRLSWILVINFGTEQNLWNVSDTRNAPSSVSTAFLMETDSKQQRCHDLRLDQRSYHADYSLSLGVGNSRRSSLIAAHSALRPNLNNEC